jgi:hypothetical protein
LPYCRQAYGQSAEVLPSGDELEVVRFRDNNGIIVEVRVDRSRSSLESAARRDRDECGG